MLDGLFNRALITTGGTDWFVAAEGYDALGIPRPDVNRKGIGQFETNLDRIIANAEGAPATTVSRTGSRRNRRRSSVGQAARQQQASRSDPDAASPKAQPSARSAPPPAGRHTVRGTFAFKGFQEAGPDDRVGQARRAANAKPGKPPARERTPRNSASQAKDREASATKPADLANWAAWVSSTKFRHPRPRNTPLDHPKRGCHATFGGTALANPGVEVTAPTAIPRAVITPGMQPPG